MTGLGWVLTLFYSPFAFITISRAMEKMDPSIGGGIVFRRFSSYVRLLMLLYR